jgi:hypothetical protein
MFAQQGESKRKGLRFGVIRSWWIRMVPAPAEISLDQVVVELWIVGLHARLAGFRPPDGAG